MDVSVVVVVVAAAAVAPGLGWGGSHRGGATSDEGPALGPPGPGPWGPADERTRGRGDPTGGERRATRARARP